MQLVLTSDLADIIARGLTQRPLGELFGHNPAALKAANDIRNRPRPWTTYWRADTILSAMGRPDLLHSLTLKEGK